MYCNKGIKCETIDKLSNHLIEVTLDDCELNCERFSLCDTVAYMEDELKQRNLNIECENCDYDC